MKTVRLGDIADVQLGKMLDKAKNTGKPYRYLANVSVRWRSFDLTDLRETLFTDDEIEKFSLKRGDILMCEGGEPGRCAIWKEDNSDIKFQKALHRIRMRKGIPEYLCYYIDLIHDCDFFKKRFTGSTIKHLPREGLLELPVPDTPIEEQKRIAGVLGAIDEKIEVNRAKINSLSLLAQSIYDYWFVQFDFPNENGKPYKSSNGKLSFNPTLKRYIPANWRTCNIAECGTFQRGVTYSKKDEVSPGPDTVSVYRGNNIAGSFVSYDSNEVHIPKSMVDESCMLKRGQILIAMSSGSKEHVGKAGLVSGESTTCAFGAFCTLFAPTDEMRYIIYNLFNSAYYRSYIKNICEGTGINNIKPEHFKRDLFAIPNDQKLIENFNKIQSPIFERILTLREEVRSLEGMRDELLPLLMNGQLQILTTK